MFSQEFSTDHGIYYNHLRKSHGKGGGVGRGSVYPPRVGSMNSYVFSRVASQVGFSNILEVRFQKVKIRIFLSNCWTWTYFFLDFFSCFIIVLHLPTLQQFLIIYHTGGQSSQCGLIGSFGIHSRTCIKRSNSRIFFLSCIVTFTTFQRWSLLSGCCHP